MADEEDTQPEDTEVVVADTVLVEQAAAPHKDETEDALAALKAQLEDEKARRVAAEQRASTLANSEHSARVEAQDSNYNLVVNAIGTLKQSQEALKSNYAAAMEAQDFAAAADYQVQMADTSAKLLQLEQGKQAMEQAPKPERQPVSTDPVEALASQLSPRSADWVRKNPQYATDSRLYTKMLAAHNIAVADGLVPDTDDYFAAVENTLGMGRPAAPAAAAQEDDSPMSAAAKPSAPPAAAPVSRGGESSNRVRLSGEEIDMAKLMGMTPEEYAKNKVALQKEGKLTTH